MITTGKGKSCGAGWNTALFKHLLPNVLFCSDRRSPVEWVGAIVQPTEDTLLQVARRSSSTEQKGTPALWIRLFSLLAWHWPSTALTLAQHWPDTGPTLPRHWPSTGPTLPWHWPSTGPAHHCADHDAGQIQTPPIELLTLY